MSPFVTEISKLKKDKFSILDECVCSNAASPKQALLSFRASAHTASEATVVQAVSMAMVHMVEELNLHNKGQSFRFGHEWPVGDWRRRSDLAIFRIVNHRTFIVIEVKESVPVDLEKTQIKKTLPQLLYAIALVSAREKAPDGKKYLGVLCDDYTFHAFTVVMNKCWSVSQAELGQGVLERPFSLEGYQTASGSSGESLEPLCRVVQSFVRKVRDEQTESREEAMCYCV